MIWTGELSRKLLVKRGNRLAWSTPICVDFFRSVQVLENLEALLLKWRRRICKMVGVGGANLQSVTTIWEDLRRSLNWPGEAICTVFDILNICGIGRRGCGGGSDK